MTIVLAPTVFASLTMLMATAPSGSAQVAQTETFSGDQNAIMVVGSRLRGDVENEAAPVSIIRPADKIVEGQTTATDILQSNAITGGNPQITNAYSGFAVDGGPGVNTVGLRGLGATRTLVLLDGHRLAPSGVMGGVSAVDLNSLPPQIIVERYEILRDGASSIYGSDAVAGVINVVTRRKMGLEVFGANSMTGQGAGAKQTLEAGFGINSSRLRITAALGYYRQNALTFGDLPWAACQTDGFIGSNETLDPVTGQPKCYTVTASGSNGATINTLATSTRAGVAAMGTSAASFNRWRANPAVTTGVAGWEGVGGTGTGLNVRDTFDPRLMQTPVISPQDLYRGFVSARYDLHALGDAEVYGSALFSDRESSQQAYTQLLLDYPKGSPLIPANLQFSTQNPVVGGSVTNPTTATGVRAFIGYGLRGSRQSVRNYRIDGGLRGQTGLGDWRYDLYAATNRSEGRYYQEQFLTDRLAQSAYVVANGSGGFSCINASRGCVAMPALTPAVVAGQLPADWLQFVKQWVGGTTTYRMDTASLTLDGTAWSMPHGPVRAALGGEFATMAINDTPPADSITGNLYSTSTAAITRGSDRTLSAFAEAELPLLRDLTLHASARWTHYHSYGDGITYKANLAYAPARWLVLRATYGTSFRAPALKEQFQGATQAFQNQVFDPCNQYGASPVAILRTNCAAAGLAPDFTQTLALRVNTVGGAAAGLKAETSRNLTLGGTFQPDWGRFGHLRLSVDYYRITVDNAVARAGFQYILNACYTDPAFGTGNAPYCRLVSRDPASGMLVVNDSSLNIARQGVAGFDIALRYGVALGKARVTLDGTATHYLSQTYQLVPDVAASESNGMIGNPAWTGQISASIEAGPARLTWTTAYVQGQSSKDYLAARGFSPAIYNFTTPNYVLHHLAAQMRVGAGLQLGLGVQNLFDTHPPYISAGFYNRVGNAPLYSGYDLYGRTVSASLTARF